MKRFAYILPWILLLVAFTNGDGHFTNLHVYGEMHTLGVSRGFSGLTTSTTTTLTLADTYYKVTGTYSDGGGKDFTVATDNRATYTGGDTKDFKFDGSSEISVSLACELTYALYKNGALIAGAESPHDFVSPAKTSSIGITALIAGVATNDYFEIWAKSDQAGITLTTTTLNVTYWGEY